MSNKYLGYPLEGKKHSPALPKGDFEVVLEKDPDYQRLSDMELRIADQVKEMGIENKAMKAEIERLWKSIVENDKKSWGKIRQKASYAHSRRTMSLRIYRNTLSKRLSQAGSWSNTHDVNDDPGSIALTGEYQADFEPDDKIPNDLNLEGMVDDEA